MNSLIQKYNIPGPRYTSYPTVPYWEEDSFSTSKWIESEKATFDATNSEQGISLYIHLPYCSTACHYCGCNMKYTLNHAVEDPYIDTVLQEWQLYLNELSGIPKIAEIHLGGGTPTFFSPANLARLINGILAHAEKMPEAHFSFEASPHSTSKEHLQTLFDLGFTRLSLGVQDFDPKVQEVINRTQSVELVKSVVDQAREIGYTSINFDLIYGLPLQTIDTIRQTFEAVMEMRPERIAYYSYAHVPWIKGIMRRFTEEDLPKGNAKRALYELGKELLESDGYVEIGMDHFALPNDELVRSSEAGTLHRNFMGYTTTNTKLMIGLGSSSISDSWGAFAQNEKHIRTYQNQIAKGELAVFRGHVLTDEDLVIRQHILNIMCRLATDWSDSELQTYSWEEGLPLLEEMVQDELVKVYPNHLEISEKGRPFIRNICMAFDARLRRKQPETRIFSTTI
jgi:oxygen-independent coproporphyrinogen-3 oxidase